MKKLVLIMMLFAFVSTATGQSMADRMAESVATHLSLNASQKQAVVKLYKAEQDKQTQKRQAHVLAKKSDKARAARDKTREKGLEKTKKAKKTRPVPKSSGKGRNLKPKKSSSDRLLMIAYGKARSNPALKQELMKVFTQQQAAKWQQIGKK